MVMRFNAKDLNTDYWVSRAKAEATLIYNNPRTRKDRTLHDIIETTLYGHAAEVYLIENENFTDDLRDFHDITDPQGVPTEIKVTGNKHYVEYVLKRANEAKRRRLNQYANKLMVFIGNKVSCDYHLHNIYYWNEKLQVFTQK